MVVVLSFWVVRDISGCTGLLVSLRAWMPSRMVLQIVGEDAMNSILGIVWGVRRYVCVQSTIEKMFGLTKTMARVQLATLLKKYRMVDHKKQHNIKSIINSSNIKIINLTFLSIINSKKRLQCVDTSSPSPSPCRTKSKSQRARVSVFELKCWIDLLSSVLVPTIWLFRIGVNAPRTVIPKSYRHRTTNQSCSTLLSLFSFIFYLFCRVTGLVLLFFFSLLNGKKLKNVCIMYLS